MMVEARRTDEGKTEADVSAAADLSRLAEASSKMFAEQAAAMAVMTAFGMSVAAQMTGMMLGALRGPAADFDEAPAAPEVKAARAAEKTSAKVVPLRPRTAKTVAPAVEPVAKPAKVKAVAAKPKPQKPATAAATGHDDLKKISGIGPRLEQELNGRGIVAYADIASLSKAAIKKLDTELGLEGRIVKDDWAGQARALSGGQA